MLGPEFPQIEASIPNDHSRKSNAVALLAEVLPGLPDGPVDLLDFGCGDGRVADTILQMRPGVVYKGVDIETSPEVDTRTRSDLQFYSYDGVNLPFEDDSFDVIFSSQVFEHVRHPDLVMREIQRVLRPGGLFVGSLSNLEPYHSYSIFNYTPYGLFRVLEDNGLKLRVMRPGVETTSLILRQLSRRRISRFELIYPAIALAGWLQRWDARRRNYFKLRFSGHICFIAEQGRQP